MGREPATPVPLALPVAAAPRPPARSTIEPVAADRWQWRIGLTAEQKAKLDRLRALLGHTIAGGDLDAVFDRMLDDSLEKHAKRLGFVAPKRSRKPAPAKAPTPGKRAPVPLAVRREVLKRDGYRARLRYGAEHVRRRMDEDRRAQEARRRAKAPPGPGTLCEPVARWMACAFAAG